MATCHPQRKGAEQQQQQHRRFICGGTTSNDQIGPAKTPPRLDQHLQVSNLAHIELQSGDQP